MGFLDPLCKSWIESYGMGDGQLWWNLWYAGGDRDMVVFSSASQMIQIIRHVETIDDGFDNHTYIHIYISYAIPWLYTYVCMHALYIFI